MTMEGNTKPTRRKEKGQRPRRVIIKLTNEEHARLQERSEKAGLYMAAYIRQMTLKGKVTARFSAEEIELFRNLVPFSNSLRQLLKLAQDQGITALQPILEQHAAQIDQLLKRWKV